MSFSRLTRRTTLAAFCVGTVGVAFARASMGLPFAKDRPQLKPDLWMTLAQDGKLTLTSHKVEMGQGVHDAYRRIAANALSLPLSAVDVTPASSDIKYGQLITGGSVSVAGGWGRIRSAAAVMRSMLLRAGAERLSAPSDRLEVAEGIICDPLSGKKISYADLVEDASKLPEPDAATLPMLKEADYSELEGLGERARLYHHSIVTGSAVYGLDIKLPGMICASIARAPYLNGQIATYDEQAARDIPGYRGVAVIEGNEWPQFNHVRQGLAVLADDHWTAQKCRDLIDIAWEVPPSTLSSDADLREKLRDILDEPLLPVHAGDYSSFSDVRMTHEATYSFPYLSHAQLEPLNATARVDGDNIEVWCGCQRQRRLHDAIVEQLDFTDDKVLIHGGLMGGAFGRRLEVDYGLEAAILAKQLDVPVQVLWSRADDFEAGLFRPAGCSRIRASTDPSGRIEHFSHQIVGESVMRQQEPERLGEDGSDGWMSAEPLAFPYDAQTLNIEHKPIDPIMACGHWRAVGSTIAKVAEEMFIDELAERADADALDYRLRHLEGRRGETMPIVEQYNPALMARVLKAAADEADWSQRDDRKTLGLAAGFYQCRATYTAAIVELTESKSELLPRRIVIATDCGVVIDRKGAEAQLISNAIFALGAALWQQVTISEGVVRDKNYSDYRVPLMRETPQIDTVFVASERAPSGLGEPATPVVTAAIANAWSRTTGQRVRSFPINHA